MQDAVNQHIDKILCKYSKNHADSLLQLVETDLQSLTQDASIKNINFKKFFKSNPDARACAHEQITIKARKALIIYINQYPEQKRRFIFEVYDKIRIGYSERARNKLPWESLDVSWSKATLGHSAVEAAKFAWIEKTFNCSMTDLKALEDRVRSNPFFKL